MIHKGQRLLKAITSMRHNQAKFTPIASFLFIFTVLFLGSVFSHPVKQAGLPDYASFSESLDPSLLIFNNSALNADLAVVYDASLSTTILDGDLISLPGYFTMPVNKKDGTIKSSLNNFINIPLVCGAPIYASAEGLVESVGEPSDWNGGFGGYIRIKHLNKDVQTIYAHISSSLVKDGDIVQKGSLIGRAGMSGNFEDIGCNLQFGILGAKNPFVR